MFPAAGIPGRGRPPRLQLQRTEDGSPLPHRRARAAGLFTDRACAGQVADLAASFQEAVVDVLLDKTFAALRSSGLRKLCVGGGVAANARFRTRLQEEAARGTCSFRLPLCGCAPTTP